MVAIIFKDYFITTGDLIVTQSNARSDIMINWQPCFLILSKYSDEVHDLYLYTRVSCALYIVHVTNDNNYHVI